MIWSIKNFIFFQISVISYLVFMGSAYPSFLPLWIVISISRVFNKTLTQTDAEAPDSRFHPRCNPPLTRLQSLTPCIPLHLQLQDGIEHNREPLIHPLACNRILDVENMHFYSVLAPSILYKVQLYPQFRVFPSFNLAFSI